MLSVISFRIRTRHQLNFWTTLWTRQENRQTGKVYFSSKHHAPQMVASIFIQSNCQNIGYSSESNKNYPNFQFRQACAIESAAKANSNSDIFVLFVTPVGFGKNGSELPPILQALQSYPNIYFRNLNITKAVANTPAEKWIPSGELFKSKYLSVHMSDFLRLVVLFHFGGTYMDLDYIIIKVTLLTY